MKKLISGAKKALLGAFLLAMSSPAFAQLGDVGTILQAGQDDAKVLLRGYMSPLVNSFGAGLNTGWVQTAKTHGLLGFHVKVGLAGIMVPEADGSFMINNGDLTALQLAPGSPTSSPTFAGGRKDATARLESRLTNPLTNQPLYGFNMPSGTGVPFGVAPVIQAGVGLIKGIQLNVRFVPETNLGESGKVGLFGAGIQYDLLQLIPLAKRLPLLDLAFTGAYSQLNMSKGLSLSKPDGVNDPQNLSTRGQALDWTTTAWNMNVIAGAATPFIKILSVYAGVGLENSGTTFTMQGNYPYQTLNGQGQPELAYVSDEEIVFDNESMVRMLAGLRLRLAVLNINVEYTVSRYQSLTFGVGIGLR